MDRRLALLYLLAGVAALGVETVWMRWLRDLLGATAPAASATLLAFFAGHALGAWWCGRRAAGFARPLAAYGWIELCAAAGALAAPALLALGELFLGSVYDALLGSPDLLNGARLGVALAATLPASFCFGAGFPAIGEAAVGSAEALGRRATALYAFNTLGAALGAALAAFVLPGRIGVWASYTAALLLLAGVALGALALDRLGGAPARAASGVPGDASAPAGRGLGAPLSLLVVVAALAGFCALALQVLAVQSLGLVLNGSVYAFGAVAVTVLVCLAAGSALVSVLERRTGFDPATLLGVALVGAALLAALFPAALARATGGLGSVGGGSPGLAYLAAALFTALATAGPVLLAAALLLPLCFALAGRRDGPGPGAGALLGQLVAANVVGGIAGALCAPYLLMPGLGLWGAFLAVAAVYALAAILLPARVPQQRRRRLGALLVGSLAVLGLASPLAVGGAGLRADEELLFSETTPAGLVQVVERPGGRLLRIDHHYALGGTAEQVHEERQAHLPLLLARAPRRVAYVGSATGISAGAALLHPVEELYVVELVPGVVRAARRFFADASRGVYESSRSRVVLDDARNFLRATGERFDLVVADLFVPWRAGTGSLYTREHFEAVRDRLRADGVFVQWLPLYQLSRPELEVIAATFLDAFPRTAVFRGDFYGRFPIAALVGFAGEPASPAAVSEAARSLAAAGVRDRWVSDPLGVWALYVGPLGAMSSTLEALPRNRDDLPWVESVAAGGHAGGERGKVDPVVGSAWMRFAEPLRVAAGGVADAIYPGLGPDQRRAVRGGALLQRAGALWVAGRADAAARAFADAASLLPERLVARAEADVTAAELWVVEPLPPGSP